jgi:hypothetical protein
MPEALAAKTAASGIGSTDATSASSTLDPTASDSTSSASSTDATSLDPSSLKDRIDSLLAQQVQSGTLTSAQADTLKSAFRNPDNGIEGGGGRRPQGPPPGPPPDATSDTASDATTTSATASTASTTDDLLASFVKQLQSSQDRTSTYGAGGTRGGGQVASSLLLNFKA